MEKFSMRKSEEQNLHAGEPKEAGKTGEGESPERSAAREELPGREAASKERSDAEKKYFELIKPENETEERILRDPEWQQGAAWDKPREGHSEVKIISHIVEVLHNVDELPDVSEHERAQLRLIALVHDAFKYRVDMSRPRFGENHHGALARKFAEKYTNDAVALNIIQRHDDAFNAWRNGHETGKWEQAKKRIRDLVIKKIGRENLRSYLFFYQCDNETGIKEQECLEWFKKITKEL
ncbi:MAG: hypothetical protein HYV25_01905 [Candidatus Harrisonbacteria bacterium]|nr:hypothetical protein [Candidatus Harrisonbacteria bacterium]